ALFVANDGSTGLELWKTDGTVAGTVRVADIRPGLPGSIGTAASAVVGGVLYFPANDGTTGQELWRSDGTSAGTTLVKDLAQGASSSNLANFTAVSSKLFFTDGSGLAVSDGTAAGTAIPINPLYGVSGLVPLGSNVLFVGTDDSSAFYN